MAFSEIRIDIGTYRQLVINLTFEVAIVNIIERYSFVPINQATINNIKAEVDIININFKTTRG